MYENDERTTYLHEIPIIMLLECKNITNKIRFPWGEYTEDHRPPMNTPFIVEHGSKTGVRCFKAFRNATTEYYTYLHIVTST